MVTLKHCPPPALNGLVSIRMGSGAFVKRQRRLAHLERAVLEVRQSENAPVEWSICLAGSSVQSDESRFCISVEHDTMGRIRLYLSSTHKFAVWKSAVNACARWVVSTHYVLQAQPFARGVFAAVYSAQPRGSTRCVAVKHISASCARSVPHMVAREVGVCHVVEHHNIIRVHDVFESAEGVHIVMDRMAYSLQAVLDEMAPLKESDAAYIMYQLLSAVAYLHGINIVHRDVKPDNVLVSEMSSRPSSVKLCDFGLANFTSRRVQRISAKWVTCESWSTAHKEDKRFSSPMDLTQALSQGGVDLKQGEHRMSPIDGQTLTSAIGAPSFTAPEVVQRRAYGAPVDVWACGISMFYMLTGALPFGGDKAADVLQRVAVDEVDVTRLMCAPLSSDAANLLRRLLNKDPRQRMTADSALRHAWFAAHNVALSPA
ncbi:Death-associated protein kinase 3 [Gracilariopsis chorda]|uniref:Death-associated protein kinase 3 n=1 Tax=Gracilariopsis chorda TaxID=448386 RepID=A0A2V3J2V7_9FLOR|nr:Death-associated protein kinase 3 [Gracilariopsis chorda]|eukprot:PXF47730.1 Death-associated protein kinase 3 [Gracilariopsis chorda]